MSEGNFTTLKGCWNYVTSTVPVSNIQSDFYQSVRQLFLALIDAALNVLYVLFYAFLLLSKLSILIFPHAVKTGKIVYTFHRTQLSTSDLVLEFTSIGLVLAGLYFRKRIQQKWKNLLRDISAKSKLAATAAPHVLFFGLSFTFSIIGRRFLLPLTSPSVMPIFSLGLPLFTTIRVVRITRSRAEQHNTDSNNSLASPIRPNITKRRDDAEVEGVSSSSNTILDDDMEESTISKHPIQEIESKMLLWVILAIYHAAVTLLSGIPFSTKVVETLPLVKEFMIVVLIWLQLSPTFCRILFDSIIYRILVRLCEMIPVGYSMGSANSQTSYFLSVLKLAYIINDAQLVFLQALFQDSVATILALVFMFTPTFIASFGMVTIAFLLPAFRTSAAVGLAGSPSTRGGSSKVTAGTGTSSSSSSISSSGGKGGTTSMSGVTNTRKTIIKNDRLAQIASSSISAVDAAHHLFHVHWLRYWVCLAALWLLRIYCTTFWPSVVMLTTLWLQHSYFRGATTLTQHFYDTMHALLDRDRRIKNDVLDNNNNKKRASFSHCEDGAPPSTRLNEERDGEGEEEDDVSDDSDGAANTGKQNDADDAHGNIACTRSSDASTHTTTAAHNSRSAADAPYLSSTRTRTTRRTNSTTCTSTG
mmetsp:Transcript_20311/g.34587  ORF Transcript_20311/g.34587 Transcript_20311/m.34587 type:complete len:644 (+) Transcript_20311:174-2105(+)